MVECATNGLWFSLGKHVGEALVVGGLLVSLAAFGVGLTIVAALIDNAMARRRTR